MVSWRYPDTTKRVRVAFVCPTGSDPALSVVGTFCPITPDVMITQCSAAYFLAWVRRNFTTRMREYIDIIRKAARGERLDHDGEFFHTKRFRLRLTPYRPNLPIYIASLSPPSLRLTGALADGWLPIYLAPSRMPAAVAELKAGAEAAGRTLQDIAISPQVSIYVTDDIAAARHRERPHIAFYIGGVGVFFHQYFYRIGFGAEADRVRPAYQAR